MAAGADDFLPVQLFNFTTPKHLLNFIQSGIHPHNPTRPKKLYRLVLTLALLKKES